MGYALVYGPCLRCKQVFSYNPHRVPSFRHPRTGEKEPLCQTCLSWVNGERKARGLDPFIAPPDAYEAIDENEL